MILFNLIIKCYNDTHRLIQIQKKKKIIIISPKSLRSGLPSQSDDPYIMLMYWESSLVSLCASNYAYIWNK